MEYNIPLLTMRMPRDARRLLRIRFTESGLAYHNVDHIIHMLSLLVEYFVDDLSDEEIDLIEAAIWWHDYVYNTKARDNELKSAEMAIMVLRLSPDHQVIMQGLIMATAGSHTFKTRLEEILVALDLAILAAPRHDYAAYAVKIRNEYLVYDDEEYRAGRIAVLDSLCAKPILHILSVAMGLKPDDLYHRAQANMRWEQSRLAIPGPIVEALTSG